MAAVLKLIWLIMFRAAYCSVFCYITLWS